MLQDLHLFRNRYYNYVFHCDPQQATLISTQHLPLYCWANA
jgi:hypothetical protein